MERVSVISSNVASMGYDLHTRTLEVEFRDGAVYQYYDVPPHEHVGLINAASHGSYLHAHIRDTYPHRRIH